MKRLTFIILLAMSVLTTGMLSSCDNGVEEIDGFVIKDGVLRKYNGVGGDVEIPYGVTIIRDSAFEGCKSLTSVTIPDSVTSIWYKAFYECTSLSSVKMGRGVTIIWDSAFEGCESLKSITIPGSVTIIKESTFKDCSGLKSVDLGNGVTTIEKSAFMRCGSLTDVTIPDSVTSIGDSAFYQCFRLSYVDLGNGVTTIGYEAFNNCALTSVRIPSSVTLINGKIFHNNTKVMSVYFEDTESNWTGTSPGGSDNIFPANTLASILASSTNDNYSNYKFKKNN